MVADTVRAKASKPAIDERTTSVTIRVRTYAGGRIGAGATSDVDVTLTPRPRVREVSQQEITNSAGRYRAGDFRVGPITPSYSGGGYSESDLAPYADANGVDIYYVLAGGVYGDFARVDCTTDRSHSYFLTLTRRRTSE